MRKVPLLILVSILLNCGCSSSSEDNDPNGKVYITAAVSPALSGLDYFAFGTEESNVKVESGSSWQTDTFLFPKNTNLVYEVGFLDSENQCYTVNIEVFFNEKSIDKRTFEMNASYNIGYVDCKDSNPQTLNVITPQ